MFSRYRESKIKEIFMISDKVVSTAAFYLFGDITFPKDFLEKLRAFMVRAYEQSNCVVLYKRLESFQEFLARFPELPDIGRREFIVMRNGALNFSPDYFARPLEEVSVINFVNDKVVATAAKYLFGIPILTLEFHKEFKEFIMKAYQKSDSVVLSKANAKFMEFLKNFSYLPDISKRKLIIHKSGNMFFTENHISSAPQKISITVED